MVVFYWSQGLMLNTVTCDVITIGFCYRATLSLITLSTE